MLSNFLNFDFFRSEVTRTILIFSRIKEWKNTDLRWHIFLGELSEFIWIESNFERLPYSSYEYVANFYLQFGWDRDVTLPPNFVFFLHI